MTFIFLIFLGIGSVVLTAFIHDLWVYRKDVHEWWRRDVLKKH